ncbi:hypothetical protein HMPREF0493_1104 [Lactobacillus amylolyticus DSM 11664]|uniref:Uncharacterized protein n=1 Tax=Lactobacillus amylolyticus DSM 11664 TaxID=585524 RepID=D4YU93_9LACO|nr:hypothetical protein HMPREF0493_1104 [Lactobacillus amylolyticus DSM 11664]
MFNAILWLVIGVITFNLTDKYVKKNGTLAQYEKINYYQR